MRYGLTTGLMIASFMFILCVCFFFWGCLVINEGTVNIMWLWCVIISFIVSIPSMYFIVICKKRLNMMMEYGEPVRLASEYIIKIIRDTDIFAVKELQGVIEKAMKNELQEVIRKEKVKKK